jgi:hypothetical protein
MTKSDNSSIANIVRLDLYPIDDFKTVRGLLFLKECHSMLIEKGTCLLPNFIHANVLEILRKDALDVAHLAHTGEKIVNPYLADNDPNFEADHPRNFTLRSQISTVANDLLSPDCLLQQLYNSSSLQKFFAAVLDLPCVYPYTDTVSSLNVTVGRCDEQLAWHFDNSDFAITMMLLESDAGGRFEYCPNIRSATDEGFEAVSKVLQKKYDNVNHLEIHPGTLVLFRGRYSLHRVTPIEGPNPRMMAILNYDSKPGVEISRATRLKFYGH